ncbi:MAG: PQQ-binding-like beta-propeller repeat protein [Vicinamibacterales bacterium]
MRSLLVTAGLVGLATAAAVAQTHTIVVLSHTDNTAYELDPTTGTIAHRFTAVNQPHEGVASADGKTFYMAIPNGPHVVILDATTFKEKGRIESEYFHSSKENGSASPHGSALTTDGSKLYVGLENADVPGIVVYDTKAGKVLKKIDVMLRGGHFLAIQPGTDKLYYPMRDDNRVLVIDTKTDRIVKIVPVEGGPVGVGFAPNGDVWIHDDGDGKVHVIDSAKDAVVKTIDSQGKGAGRMAVSPNGQWAASTHGGTQDVAIFDASKKTVAATVPLGKGPGFPIFSPDSSKLYVMNYGEGDVAIVDLASMKVVARHKVGATPFGGGLRFPNGRPTSQD